MRPRQTSHKITHYNRTSAHRSSLKNNICIIPTKSGTFMYHLTMDWDTPILSLSQSPSFHIPRINVGSHGLNQNKTKQGTQKLNHLHPQATVISPKLVQISLKRTQAWMPKKFFTIPKGIFLPLPTFQGAPGENHIHPQPLVFF